VLVRELVGGDPPYASKVILLDQPTGFGHRVTDGGWVLESVLTNRTAFDETVTAMLAEGFTETDWSLTRRVFVTTDLFWIVALDGDTLHTQFGRIRPDWRQSSGQVREREYRTRDRAVAAYHRAVVDKIEEGYREADPRPVQIDASEAATKKTGKRKSR
jgi:predicted DNA-binding WGR domain protein